MRDRAVLPLFAPLTLALAALVIVAASGFTQRDLFGTALEDRFYGFFLDRCPLFLFAIIYGLAHIALAACEPPRRWGRIVAAPLGAALFLGVCLHPTFGGLVLRPGYMTGTVAFLNGAPMPAALAAGATASALVYGIALGLGVMLARLRRPAMGWRVLRRSAVGFLAIGFGALVLAAPWGLGVRVAGDWPARPLSPGAAIASLGLVALALLPHTLQAARNAARLAQSKA